MLFFFLCRGLQNTYGSLEFQLLWSAALRAGLLPKSDTAFIEAWRKAPALKDAALVDQACALASILLTQQIDTLFSCGCGPRWSSVSSYNENRASSELCWACTRVAKEARSCRIQKIRLALAAVGDQIAQEETASEAPVISAAEKAQLQSIIGRLT